MRDTQSASTGSCVTDEMPVDGGEKTSGARRQRGRRAPSARAFAGVGSLEGPSVADAFAREDGLYGVLYVTGPSKEAAAEGMAAMREVIDRLPREKRSPADLSDALLEAHARLDALNEARMVDDGKEQRRLVGMVGLMSRTDDGLDIAHVGFIRTLVVRCGKLLQPLAPPHERLNHEGKAVADLLGSGHRPRVALSHASSEGGDLFAMTTRAVVLVPEPQLLDLLGRAHAEDMTGALAERLGVVVTIPISGRSARPEVGCCRGVSWAALSSVGMRRANEDAYRIAGDVGLFACGDGLGGHEGGAEASRIAVGTAVEVFGAEGPWIPVEETARRAFELASLRVAKATHHGGSTLDVVRIRDGGAVVAHLGDSRVYLFRDGKLEQLTEDHSVVADMVRQGTLTPEQARNDPHRNIITRAVGLNSVAPDVAKVALRKGGILLLCTDGLTGPVPDARIAEILAGARGDLAGATQDLVDAAYEGGAQDNVTAVVVRIDDPRLPASPSDGHGRLRRG